jgi:hypothetical protein
VCSRIFSRITPAQLHLLLVLRVEDVVVGIVAVLLLQPEHLAEAVAVDPRERAEDDTAVLRGVAAVEEAAGQDALLAHLDELRVAPSRLARRLHLRARHVVEVDVGDRVVVDVVALQPHAGAEQRGVDLLALARALAVEERRGDAHRSRHRRAVVGRRAEGGGDGCAILGDLAVAGHDPRVGLRDHVRAALARQFAARPEAGALDVDEVLAELPQRLVVDADALGDAVAVVHHHHVDGRHEPVDDLAPLGLLQVDDDAALATVERLKRLALVGHGGARLPQRLAAGRLDLDHVGAEV